MGGNVKYWLGRSCRVWRRNQSPSSSLRIHVQSSLDTTNTGLICTEQLVRGHYFQDDLRKCSSIIKHCFLTMPLPISRDSQKPHQTLFFPGGLSRNRFVSHPIQLLRYPRDQSKLSPFRSIQPSPTFPFRSIQSSLPKPATLQIQPRPPHKQSPQPYPSF